MSAEQPERRALTVRILFNRYWLLLPLLLVAVVVHNWVDAPAPAADDGDFDMRSTRSDYYLEEFRTQRFDGDGRREYEVSGKSLIHYPDDGRSDIVAPDIALFEMDGVWTVTARRGRFTESPELFRLQDDVRIARKGTNAMTIRTAELDLLPATREIRTDATIEIVGISWQLRARGLRSTLDSGNLQLLNEVSGTYDVPDPASE